MGPEQRGCCRMAPSSWSSAVSALPSLQTCTVRYEAGAIWCALRGGREADKGQPHGQQPYEDNRQARDWGRIRVPENETV